MTTPPLVLAPLLLACESRWQDYKSDCSGFVKAVAADLGITLTGQANSIVDQIGRSPWVPLKHDGLAAKSRAESGSFVIGGLKDSPNGHVVIVTPGPLAQGKYPTAYWGQLHGVGKKDVTINWAWNATDRDKVIYAYIPIP